MPAEAMTVLSALRQLYPSFVYVFQIPSQLHKYYESFCCSKPLGKVVFSKFLQECLAQQCSFRNFLLSNDSIHKESPNHLPDFQRARLQIPQEGR